VAEHKHISLYRWMYVGCEGLQLQLQCMYGPLTLVLVPD